MCSEKITPETHTYRWVNGTDSRIAEVISMGYRFVPGSGFLSKPIRKKEDGSMQYAHLMAIRKDRQVANYYASPMLSFCGIGIKPAPMRYVSVFRKRKAFMAMDANKFYEPQDRQLQPKKTARLYSFSDLPADAVKEFERQDKEYGFTETEKKVLVRKYFEGEDDE